jgi:UDP-N-acetylglucosamine--N-acetylmuramyl-(pentapeptide) pyrophosphoryl-undecaprenol N-acetylglucosamine transferase
VQAAYEKSKVPAEVNSFFSNMASVYQRADLAVCRAGATTVAELSALAIPAIFIPYPHAADDHQRLNAKNLCDAGAAEMVLERDLNGDFLAQKIIRLVENREMLQKMAKNAESLGLPDAAERIVEDCRRLIAEKSGIRKKCI